MPRKKDKEKAPIICRWFGHDWQRYRALDTSPNRQACKCKRCGKVMYLGG